MSAAKFRRIALSMPQATEGAHMGHPDFRVKGKIFATLFPQYGMEWGVVKLRPDQQRQWITQKPEVFSPVPGGWGRQGCTRVCLETADQKSMREAIFTAWCNTAPPSLLESVPNIRGRKKVSAARPRRKSVKKAGVRKRAAKKKGSR